MGINKTLRKLSFSVAKKDHPMHIPESNTTQNDLSFTTMPTNPLSSKFHFAPSVTAMEEWLAETTRSLKKHFPEHTQPNNHRKLSSQDYKNWFMPSRKSSVSTPPDSIKPSPPPFVSRSRQSINSKNYHLPPTFNNIDQSTIITTTTQINPHCKLKRSYNKFKKVTPADSTISESAPCYSFMAEHTPLPGSRTRSRSHCIQRETSFSEDVKPYEKSHLSQVDLGSKADFVQNFESELTVEQVVGVPMISSAYNYEVEFAGYKRYSPKDLDDSFFSFNEDYEADFEADYKKEPTPSFHRSHSLGVDSFLSHHKVKLSEEELKSPTHRHTMPAVRSMSELGEIIGQAHKHQRTKTPPVQTNGAMRTIVINPPITCPLFQPVQVNTWECDH